MAHLSAFRARAETHFPYNSCGKTSPCCEALPGRGFRFSGFRKDRIDDGSLSGKAVANLRTIKRYIDINTCSQLFRRFGRTFGQGHLATRFTTQGLDSILRIGLKLLRKLGRVCGASALLSFPVLIVAHGAFTATRSATSIRSRSLTLTLFP